MSEQQSILRRAYRSNRVRAFVIVSVLVHAAVLTAFAVSEELQKLLPWYDDGEIEQVEASPASVRRAVETLLKMRAEHYTTSLKELQAIRAEMDEIQRQKLERLRAVDRRMKELIDKGEWPTPEHPDPTAQFVARVDIEPPPIEQTPVPAPPEPPYTSDLEKLRDQVLELYRLHPPVETDTMELFERYHALELAAFAGEPIPLSRSLDNTRMDMPERADLNVEALDTHIVSATDGKLAAFRHELTQGWLNIQDMLNNARSQLNRARASEQELAGMFGAQYDIIPPPEPYYGHYLNPKLLKAVEAGRAFVDDDFVKLGHAVGGETGLLGSEWISLNRWYIIGPFQHPSASRRLEDLERKFGPEVAVDRGVDLGATYVGKGGKPLRWKYREIGDEFLEGGKRVEPYSVDNTDFGIWYFFTEIYAAQDMTVLGSFGSDDYGVCWVNGERVYQSPPTERPWQLFTADSFRVVPLKKGVNQVLFKLENARGSTGLGAALMTYEDKDLLGLAQE